MAESKMSKTKLGVIAGVVVAVLAGAGGIFKAVGCEQGAAVTDQIGNVVQSVTPKSADPEPQEIVDIEPEVITPDTIRLESKGDCGEVSFMKSLTVGDRGPNVRALQAFLVCEGESIALDGVYGDETAEAVAKRLGE